jgi:hypothetical protein
MEKLARGIFTGFMDFVSWYREAFPKLLIFFKEFLLLANFVGEHLKQGTPLGDLATIVSPGKSDPERIGAVRRLMKDRTPIARPRYNAYKDLIWKELAESAALGRFPEEEFDLRIITALFEAFQVVANYPFAYAVYNKDMVISIIFKKVNNLVMEDLFGPDWRKVRGKAYSTLVRPEEELSLDERGNAEMYLKAERRFRKEQAKVEAMLETEMALRKNPRKLGGNEIAILEARADGIPFIRIAKDLGITSGHARVVFHRAKAKLQGAR